MEQTKDIIKGIKSLMESKLFNETSKAKKMEQQLKYYKTLIPTLVNLLEIKEQCKCESNCKRCLLATVFENYCVYVKAVEVMLNADKLMTITKKERDEFLHVLKAVKKEEELDVLIDKLDRI
ncbi:MAG TPA: hypothetical protein DCP90_07825 [Clostridiales bacterium]|nr:MAG: hypothetical protein A2Y22_06020 [Clostridiales bacterium GWD2_32_59]HAN10507.1 hypothetical protein [Clostridiales bacterium]